MPVFVLNSGQACLRLSLRYFRLT